MTSAQSHSQPSDEELMRSLVGGDLDALGLIYQRHSQAVLRFLIGTLGNLQSAEDLCQETFLSLPRLVDSYQEQGKLRGWLIGLAARRARSWRRRQRWRALLFGEHHHLLAGRSTASPEELSIASQTEGRVQHAMANLAAEQRAALVLQLGEGMSGVEIAETLGVGHATVRVWLHRAKKSVSKALETGTEPGRTS